MSKTAKEILVIVGALALFEFLIKPVGAKMLAGVPPQQPGVGVPPQSPK